MLCAEEEMEPVSSFVERLSSYTLEINGVGNGQFVALDKNFILHDRTVEDNE